MVGLVHLYKYRQRNAEDASSGIHLKHFNLTTEALFVERWVSCYRWCFDVASKS
jgi:hypothetical protein